MSKKSWSGRFSCAMDPEAISFGASIPFDQKLALYDLKGSLAYSRALQKVGLLTQAEARQISSGLNQIRELIAAGRLRPRLEWEDIHTHIEKWLIQKVGSVGGKLHAGRSRNDQVVTALRLYCIDELERLRTHLQNVQQVLLDKAEAWIDVPMPGYTHLQRAQPVLISHHLLAYIEMFARDEERVGEVRKRVAVLPLGSGALAGNPFEIDRQALAQDLGFNDISHNSLDAVSDRDFAVECAATCSLIMLHLSRFAEEIILWATTEFGFIRLPEDYCTGSSMMPQKVNPDVPELVRGKTGRVFGGLISLLTMLKGLPLAYNKDTQEDKEPLFDLFETVAPSLSIMAALFRKTDVNRDRLSEAVSDDVMLATDVADWLVKKKVPFRQAHEIVAQLVREATRRQVSLSTLPLPLLKRFSPVFTQEVYAIFKPLRSIDQRTVVGGTASRNVRKEIRRHQRRIKKANSQ